MTCYGAHFLALVCHNHPKHATCLFPWLMCLIYPMKIWTVHTFMTINHGPCSTQKKLFFIKWRKCPDSLWIIYAGCHAVSTEGSDSQSTASVTSTWFWSPTSRVQEISCAWALKAQRLVGWAWAATGVKTGSQTQFSLVSHCPSGSQAVTDAPLLHGT